MDYALYMVVVGCFAFGVAGALARTWSLHSRLYSLEDRVGVIEGTLTREVKIRAAQIRHANKPTDETLFKELAAAAPANPVRKKNWWERVQVPAGH